MNAIWDKHVPDISLPLVASDTWLGGNIAVHSGPATQVFIDGSYDESPWLDREDALNCGLLVVYSKKTKGEPSPAIRQLFEQGRWQGMTAVRWSSDKSPMIDLNWAIIPPDASCQQKKN
jgi:hypothetical protein